MSLLQQGLASDRGTMMGKQRICQRCCVSCVYCKDSTRESERAKGLGVNMIFCPLRTDTGPQLSTKIVNVAFS